MAADAGVYAREYGYLGSYVQLGIAQQRVISVSFPALPAEDAGDEHDLLDRIGAYLEGSGDDFDDVGVALTLPTAQRRVLEAVREIPYGEEASVAEIAGMTAGLEGDEAETHDRVREALDANPTPIFVPDHRVRDGPSAAPPAIEQRLRAVENL
jgi:methylated-DNA-[protein]-cysteine S-methyltransferase